MIDMAKGIGIGLIIGLLLGFGGGWWVRGHEVKSLKTELKVEKDANQVNQATIAAQKDEIRKAVKSCNARVESKDKTLKRLKLIDSLNSGGKNEKDNSDNSADPLLDELNRMYQRPVSKN